jgi:acyl dehydratase
MCINARRRFMVKVLPIGKIKDFIGKEVMCSDWFLIDQDRINSFADTTGDHQYIHVDVEKAKSGPFGTTIAHGLLTLSLLPTLAGQGDSIAPEGTKTVVNYGFNKVRFVSPVKVNS